MIFDPYDKLAFYQASAENAEAVTKWRLDPYKLYINYISISLGKINHFYGKEMRSELHHGTA